MNPLEKIPLPVRTAFYGVFFLGIVLVAVPYELYWFFDSYLGLHYDVGWFRIAGVTAFAALLFFYITATYILTSRGLGANVEFDPPKQFVSQGPYLYTRNPVVVSLVGATFAEALAMSSSGILAWACVAAIVAHLQVVYVEEPLLRKRFGEAYGDYCRRVPRWIPSLRRQASGAKL